MVDMIKTRINGRWDIMLPKHRAERPEWDITNGGWEKSRLDSMERRLGVDDVIYYVGAEEGDMAALCAMWGARIVLLEPNELVLPNIKAIWEANNLPNPIRVLPEFAANEDHNPLFNTTIDKISGDVIPDHGFKELNAPGDISRVKIDTLADYLAIPPTAISIDVEGSEWEVLRGAEQTLKKYHPKIWLSLHPEFLYEKYKEYSADLRQWIKDRGYNETLLDYQHEVHLFYEAKV